MAVEKTITVKLDTAQAVTDLKKVRGEIDITYAELRRTTPIELDGSKAKSVLKDVSNEIKSTAKETKELGKEGSKSFGEMGDAISELLPIIPEIDDLGSGLKMIGTAADTSSGFFDKLKVSTKGFGLALKATGIGLIVAALVKMQEALGKNQVVMDKVNVIMETINITLGKFVNNIVKAFTNPQETIKKFGDTIQTYVVDYVQGAIESIGLFGEAIGKVFKGEFKEAADLAKKGAKTIWDTNPIVKMNKAVIGLNKNIAETVTENNKSAKALVQLRKEVKLAEADQRLLQLTYQKEAELQRQIRDDVSLTMDERVAANEKLGQILEEQFAEEQALAEKKLELAELELSTNEENIDLQIAVTNAKTEMADLDERITGQRSEQLINLISLEKEQAEAIKATAEAQAQASKEFTDKIVNRNMSATEKEIQGVKDSYQEKYDILQQQFDSEAILIGDFLSLKNELETEEAQKIKAINDAVIQEKLDKEMDFYGGEMRETLIQAAERAGFDMSEVRRDGARKEGDWTNEALKNWIDSKNIEVEITKVTSQEKVDAAKGVLGAMQGLFKEGTAGAKASAMAQILIDTATGISSAISGATAAAAGTGPAAIFTQPVFLAQMIATVLTGIANAKATLSKVKGGGGGGGGSANVSVPSGGGMRMDTSTLPNMELIGNTQLGEDTPVEPMKAFVVENDISSSQALQEELETQATL